MGCLETKSLDSIYFLFCGHVLCVNCATQLREKRCPCCRFDLRDLRRQAVIMGDFVQSSRPSGRQWSSKLCSMVDTLQKVMSEDPSAKVIIFCQWASLRMQVARALSQIGVAHLLLDGDIFERSRTIYALQT